MDGAILHSIAVANAEYCWVQSHRMFGLIVDEMSPCFRHLSRGESVSRTAVLFDSPLKVLRRSKGIPR